MRACLRYAPMIGSREGELSAEDARALAAHLVECASCGALAAEVAATEGLLSEALLARANARDFAPFVDEVMARVSAPAGRARRARALAPALGAILRAHWKLLTATAVAAVAAVSVFMYVGREVSEPEQLASLEMDLEGGSTVLQTVDGPVVLIPPDDNSGS